MTSFELYLKRNAKKFDTYLATFFTDGTHPDMGRYLYAPVAEFSSNAGKRHRPLICLLACEAVGGDPEKAWPSRGRDRALPHGGAHPRRHRGLLAHSPR